MTRPPPEKRHWPVVAWLRLRLPPTPPPITLAGPPPPPEPPLDILVSEPVVTDPRRRVFTLEDDRGDWVLRVVWEADNPGLLTAEMKRPVYGARPPGSEVAEFWKAVKSLIEPLGRLPVESADPYP